MVLAPFLLGAQHYYILPEAPPPNTMLLNINDVTVMIQPDVKNREVHKWLSLDSTLQITAAKKLVTPHASKIIGQTYLSGRNTILRVDQFIQDDIFHVSAFVFDENGDIQNKQEVNLASAARKSLLPSPFLVLQSPDKRMVSLVQVQKGEGDSLLISAISISEELTTNTSHQFVIAFNEELQELLVPLNDDQGNIYFFTVDKFNSYTLSSAISGYRVSGHGMKPTSFQIPLDRKKVKDFNFQIADDKLWFAALFSSQPNKAEVAGVLYACYNLQMGKLTAYNEKMFNNAFKAELKKQFGNEGRKGNLLNYLAPLPHPSMIEKNMFYGVLLPATVHTVGASKAVTRTPDGIAELRDQLNYINSFVGAQPNGYAKPMNYAEARSYAAVASAGNRVRNPNYYQPFREKYRGSGPKNQIGRTFNLLYVGAGEEHQTLKIKLPNDAALQFFTYTPNQFQYRTLHYHTNSFSKHHLKLTSIAANAISEKNIEMDKDKILTRGYPFLVFENNLIAFYNDKMGKMGLVKVLFQ